MKLIAIASSLLLIGLATAQDQQSRPFNLVVSSSDTALDGQKLVSCHSGAAIQSLCIYGAAGGSEFFFNTTEGAQSPLEGYEAGGSLVWNLNIRMNPDTYITCLGSLCKKGLTPPSQSLLPHRCL